MNRHEWQGFKTIFRNNKVYLYNATDNTIFTATINGGGWRDLPDKAFRRLWTDQLDTALRDHLRACAAACYCGHCGVELCDYCAGLRTPDPDGKEADNA